MITSNSFSLNARQMDLIDKYAVDRFGPEMNFVSCDVSVYDFDDSWMRADVCCKATRLNYEQLYNYLQEYGGFDLDGEPHDSIVMIEFYKRDRRHFLLVEGEHAGFFRICGTARMELGDHGTWLSDWQRFDPDYIELQCSRYPTNSTKIYRCGVVSIKSYKPYVFIDDEWMTLKCAGIPVGNIASWLDALELGKSPDIEEMDLTDDCGNGLLIDMHYLSKPSHDGVTFTLSSFPHEEHAYIGMQNVKKLVKWYKSPLNRYADLAVMDPMKLTSWAVEQAYQIILVKCLAAAIVDLNPSYDLYGEVTLDGKTLCVYFFSARDSSTQLPISDLGIVYELMMNQFNEKVYHQFSASSLMMFVVPSVARCCVKAISSLELET